jgi:hypothetical protein
MTPADLYYMAMESNTAGNLMHELCRALNTPYPPRPDDYTEIGTLQAIQLQQRQPMQADNCITH